MAADTGISRSTRPAPSRPPVTRSSLCPARRQDKCRADQNCVEAHWADSTHEHQPQPAMVYISQPTENGTVYSLAELEAISAACREKRSSSLWTGQARHGAGLHGRRPARARPAHRRVLHRRDEARRPLRRPSSSRTRPWAGTSRYIIKQRGGMFAKGQAPGRHVSKRSCPGRALRAHGRARGRPGAAPARRL